MRLRRGFRFQCCIILTFRISGFQFPLGHADVTDTTTRLRPRVSLCAFGAYTPCGPAATRMCSPARGEHGALLEGVPLRNTRFARLDLRGASTGREVAHRLAYLPRGHGVTAVPLPAPLTKQGGTPRPSTRLDLG